MHAKEMMLQAAMEYLATYGWAILIIAVVLLALYYIGVFSGNSGRITSCVANTGYLCTTPTLNSEGSLNVDFGLIGSQATISAVGCSNSSAEPSSFNSITPIRLATGETVNLTFQCAGVAPNIGSHFSGTLWIAYSTALQSNLIAEIGTVTVTVSSIHSASNNVIVGYVPITITNSQSSATGANFQQMLTVDSATYGNYINSAWSNIEFSTGAADTGTILQAWVESGATNSASSTIVWVLLTNSIAADSNTVIYMNFMSSNVMSSSGPTGEAPQLSPSYAEYDNGARVFPALYQNFAGTSTPSGWASGGNPVIDNGLSIVYQSGTLSYVWTSNAYNPNPSMVFDIYGYLNGGGAGYNYGFGIAQPPSYFNLGWWMNTNLVDTAWPADGSYSITPSTIKSIYSMVYPANGELIASYNYGTWDTVTGGSASGAANWLAGFMYSSGISGEELYTQWARFRTYPPNGVMPSASFGAFV